MRTTLAVLVVLAVAPGAAAGPLDAPGAAKAVVCSACHGEGGQSPSNVMPILAGMPSWYLKKAVEDYAAGRRLSPEMEPYAKQVLQLGVDEIAAYFAGQTRRPPDVRPDPAAVERGRAGAGQCVGCHTASGKGDPAKGIPDITGQPPGYLQNQMLLFKTDRRSPGDESLKALKAFFKTLPDEQIADLAGFYSSLR
jgi:cytochrome c553